MAERIHRDMKWTEEDRARHRAIREKFQKEKPSLQQLIESGDADPAMPLGRWGEPDDAARLVAWLVSDDARWVTGQVIDSEGGFRR